LFLLFRFYHVWYETVLFSVAYPDARIATETEKRKYELALFIKLWVINMYNIIYI